MNSKLGVPRNSVRVLQDTLDLRLMTIFSANAERSVPLTQFSKMWGDGWVCNGSNFDTADWGSSPIS